MDKWRYFATRRFSAFDVDYKFANRDLADIGYCMDNFRDAYSGDAPTFRNTGYEAACGVVVRLYYAPEGV